MLYLCFYLEEKGSVEIKEGRVSSKAEHQKKTTKSRFKLFSLHKACDTCMQHVDNHANCAVMGEAHTGSTQLTLQNLNNSFSRFHFVYAVVCCFNRVEVYG